MQYSRLFFERFDQNSGPQKLRFLTKLRVFSPKLRVFRPKSGLFWSKLVEFPQNCRKIVTKIRVKPPKLRFPGIHGYCQIRKSAPKKSLNTVTKLEAISSEL